MTLPAPHLHFLNSIYVLAVQQIPHMGREGEGENRIDQLLSMSYGAVWVGGCPLLYCKIFPYCSHYIVLNIAALNIEASPNVSKHEYDFSDNKE